MAIITTDSPASKPRPTLIRPMARTISPPRPPAPTMPAMTTIDRLSMITWLMPAMIDGSASGIWIWRSTRAGDAPKA